MKDPCIRNILKSTELYHYLHDNDTKIVEELNIPIGKARIDIAVLNGSFIGFEIKSASDSLARLNNQISAYEKVFDYVSVVTEEKYKFKLLETLPDWVGVLVCDEGMDVYPARQSLLNTNIDAFHLAKLLWRVELLDFLKELNIQYKKTDRNWILCEKIASNIEARTVSDMVRAKLKLRQDWKL